MRLLDTTAGISTLGGTGTVEGSARASARAFRIPDGAEAGTPAELRAGDGRIGSDARAAVRLMVAHRSTGDVSHHRFADLPAVLDPGDVLVVNTSAVIPAALDARSMRDPEAPPLRLHLSTRQPGGFWVVEPRRPVGPGTERHADPPPADLALAGGGRAHLARPLPGRRRWGHGPAVARPPRPAHRHARLPGGPWAADPLRAHRPGLADRGLPDGVRAGAGVGGDAERGPAVHGRVGDRPGHAQRGGRAGDPAHRGVVAGGR